MTLSPLVEIRSWLQQAPWLWDSLIFLGDHAEAVIAAAVGWVIVLLFVKVRRGDQPTRPAGSSAPVATTSPAQDSEDPRPIG